MKEEFSWSAQRKRVAARESSACQADPQQSPMSEDLIEWKKLPLKQATTRFWAWSLSERSKKQRDQQLSGKIWSREKWLSERVWEREKGQIERPCRRAPPSMSCAEAASFGPPHSRWPRVPASACQLKNEKSHNRLDLLKKIKILS